MQTIRIFRIALTALLAGAIVLAIIFRENLDVVALQTWLHDAGMLAPAVFMLVYALAAVLFLPGSIMTLAGGAMFGPLLGTFYNLTGATLGATLAFLLTRYLAGDWMARRMGGRLKQLNEGVEAEGWRFVAFVRLVPLLPFNLLNYALGLTRIRLSHYIVASYLFMLPGAITYTYLGYTGREAIAGGEGLIQKGLFALGLVAAAAFLPRLIGRLRQKPMLDIPELKQRLDAGEDLLVLDVRSAEDFAGEQGRIAGALNIPLEELPSRLAELGACGERPIVLVCRGERRSSQAAQLLTRQGCAGARVARGGMTAWRASGFQVEYQGDRP
jgi:uncharacterized membrane protein YdjX (TVP38/TMEM64 family)/rhodanese-related sulfurtransferase